jgi:protein-S-isoprenylcysteine O-methyltransferase Ste14
MKGGLTVFLLATLFQTVIFVGLAGMLIFGTAGRLDLWNVWAYLAIALGLALFRDFAMYRLNPDLVKERIKPAASGRFRLLMVIGALATFTLHWASAGLDQRLHWTDRIPPAGVVAGLVIFALGMGFGVWPMLVNRFFSTAVRIQSERGHEVISSGPYAIVRHPGYAGFVLLLVASGVALNSLLSILPALVIVAVVAFRTADEDRMLQRDLAGYAEYSKKVRYRLVPGVW